MRITRGQSYFRLPSVSGYPSVTNKEMWKGVLRACGVEEHSYKYLANITWQNTSSPMILFSTSNEYGIWARAYIRGWGRGIIRYSGHPHTMELYSKYRQQGQEVLDNLLFSLAFHELGHIVGNTVNQDIGYPPKKWFVDRLVNHYGKPHQKFTPPPEADSEVVEIALPLDDLSWIAPL